MAQKVTAMDVRMATALSGSVGNVAEFCRRQQISRQTFYKWRRRWLAGGLGGLADRPRVPFRPFGQTAPEVEDEVVRWRKLLIESGADHGPQTICWMMRRAAADGSAPAGVVVPSRATIARILSRRGLVTPAPQKRPKSSLHRFVYARPNECWQSDWTHWQLADGTPVAIAGTLDDHSRFLAGLGAAAGDATTALVWAVLRTAIAVCGIPVRSLTDNGVVYSLARRGGIALVEANLRALGCQPICSTPYHPQTCGKIERFWQTLKKWLAAHDPPGSVEELNALLAEFADFYNQRRPHRALGGATPAEAFTRTEKARPAQRPLPAPLVVTTATVGPGGVLSAAGTSIGVGTSWAGHSCDVIIDGDHVTVFSGTRLLRELTIDPGLSYQPRDTVFDRRGHREPTQ